MTNKYIIIGAAAAGIALVFLAKKGVQNVAEAVNPLNNDNVINKGVESVYQWATGSPGTIGTDLYDVTHNGTFDFASDNNLINRAVQANYQWLTGSTGTMGTDLYDVTHNGTLNPASDNNLVNRGVSWIGETVTGQKGWTLGGQIYDWTH